MAWWHQNIETAQRRGLGCGHSIVAVTFSQAIPNNSDTVAFESGGKIMPYGVFGRQHRNLQTIYAFCVNCRLTY